MVQDSAFSSPHLDIVGKRIRHKWVAEYGKEEWYCGCILSLVPGTIEWFNSDQINVRQSDNFWSNIARDSTKLDLSGQNV